MAEGVNAIIHAAPRTELKGNIRSPLPRALIYPYVCICCWICIDKNDFIVTELHLLRDILMHKYGREYSQAVMDNKDGCVTERVSVSDHTNHSSPIIPASLSTSTPSLIIFLSVLYPLRHHLFSHCIMNNHPPHVLHHVRTSSFHNPLVELTI